MDPFKTLKLGNKYSKKDLSDLLEQRTLSLVREGLYHCKNSDSTLFFVDLEKKGKEDRFHFDDFFEGDFFHWDSQTTQHINSPKIQEIVTKQIRKIPKINSSMTLTSSESGQLFQIAEKLVGAMLGQNSSQAYVVFHCEKGEEYPTLKNLCKIPEIKEADVVFGYYDVICRVESSSEEVLQDVITRAIRGLPNLKTSMTLNIIKEQESK